MGTSRDNLHSPRRQPLCAIRWGAVLGGLAVGLSIHLLLSIMGFAVGLAVTDIAPSESRGAADAIPAAAAAWNMASMVVAALVGGFVAARMSGLLRSADGMLHGVVAWGVTTLLLAVLATTALGTVMSGLLGVAERVNARTVSQGVSVDAVVDTASLVGWWVSASILFALGAGITGGWLGARSARRMPHFEAAPRLSPPLDRARTARGGT